MKKQLVCLYAVLIFLAQAPLSTFAQSTITGPVKIAIKKYKQGNYTGCLQDCMNIVYHHPKNATAYYYMAMSYVQADKKDKAISAYSKVLALNPNAKLAEYAATGKRCLETPDSCRLQADNTYSPDIDRLIAAPASDGLSDSVKSDFQKKHLDSVRNKINSGKEFDEYEFRKFKDYSKLHSKAESNDVIAQLNATNEEIAAALNVLKKAGINPYAQVQTENIQEQTSVSETVIEPHAQSASYQNPELMQLQMLMGGRDQSMDGNSMANMIPYMIAQQKNGTAGYSPQLMQAVIMNSMMSNLNFSMDNSYKDK